MPYRPVNKQVNGMYMSSDKLDLINMWTLRLECLHDVLWKVLVLLSANLLLYHTSPMPCFVTALLISD